MSDVCSFSNLSLGSLITGFKIVCMFVCIYVCIHFTDYGDSFVKVATIQESEFESLNLCVAMAVHVISVLERWHRVS